jgi:hypothetical protein
VVFGSYPTEPFEPGSSNGRLGGMKTSSRHQG